MSQFPLTQYCHWCTDTQTTPRRFASIGACVGISGVSAADTLPNLFHLGMDALTAYISLALAVVLGGPPASTSTDANAGSDPFPYLFTKA